MHERHSTANKPAFVILPYQDYMKLAADDDELIPFAVADYIANPLKAARIDAGLTQADLADRLDVSQAYIAKVEAPAYKPSERLMRRVTAAIAEYEEGLRGTPPQKLRIKAT